MSSPRTRKTSAKRRSSSRHVAGEIEFNPNSFNAQFASLHAKVSLTKAAIEQRFDLQDTELKEIKSHTSKTNGRVTALETAVDTIKTEKRISKAYVAGIAGAVSFFVTVAGVAVKMLR